jgi:hypothetical protein
MNTMAPNSPDATTIDAVQAPDVATIDALKAQLYTALQLEHATIPPYLTAFYSLKPGKNIDAQQILRVIVVEEMLHLAIAANLMNAIGGRVDLTRSGFVPTYPSRLPDGESDFEVGLGPFGESQLKTFLQIERPRMAAPDKKRIARKWHKASPLVPLPPGQAELRYYSIGEFYASIEAGIRYLEERAQAENRTIFSGDRAWQVTSEYYYSGGGRLEPITDLKSALRGINLIIEQGEGELRGVFGDHGELAHYYRFHQLLVGRYYLPGDEAEKPSGPTFNVAFEEVYPIKTNIRMSDYPQGSELQGAARTFNAAYRTFLADLTKAFNGEPALLLKAVAGMFELRNMFDVLVRNPLPNTEFHAGPTFEIDLVASDGGAQP